MAKAKFETYTIRNRQGELLSRHGATSPRRAIETFLATQNSFRSTFKTPASRRLENFSAKVEDLPMIPPG